MSERLLFDTSVVLVLARAGKLGAYIERTYRLHGRQLKPLVSVITVGEALVLARRNKWGKEKLRKLDKSIGKLVVVDVNDPAVIEAYVDIDLARPKGTGAGDNDLWIAAAARATQSKLLTTDKDFDWIYEAGMLDRDWIDPVFGKG